MTWVWSPNVSIHNRQSFLLFVVGLCVCVVLVLFWLGDGDFRVFLFFQTNTFFVPYCIREGESLYVCFPLEMHCQIQKFPWSLKEYFAEVMERLCCLPISAVP